MGKRLRATALAVVLAVFAGMVTALPAVLLDAGPAAADTAITSPTGPLTSIGTSSFLNCSVNHIGDTNGEWYGGTSCGTFASIDGTLYGPFRGVSYTAVSQTGPTGAGTAADPYRVVTTVAAGATGVNLEQTDSYVVGEESYRTDVRILNATGASRVVRLYRAGDCYLQDSDSGFGVVNAAAGSVACKSAPVGSDRIQQFLPITPGSSYSENYYSTVYGQIDAQTPFPDTCVCDQDIDNGMGLSWDATVPANGATTVSSILTFSPLGIVPLTVTKTADAPESAPGAGNGYTITVTNPNSSAVALSAITDALPTGFAYVPGSTTGLTTNDPTGGPSALQWNGPLSIGAGATATLHFGVTVSSTPGTYTNTASATAAGYEVITTGAAASITVTGTAVSPLVVALAPATSSGPVSSPYTATATVTKDAVAQAGVPVTFTVVSGPSAGNTGAGTTDAAGVATYSYSSDAFGVDTIQASVVDGAVTRTSNTVTQEWGELPPPTTDLTITSEGQPASVTAGASALRIITVTNTGEGTASGVSVAFTLPPGTSLVSSDPSQGTCGAVVEGTVTCDLGDLAGGAGATVRFVITTPTTIPEGGTITTSATATVGEGSPTEPAESTTSLAPPTPGSASGFVPPGGTLSTGTDATATDNTVASFTLPNTGSGAAITITSVPCAPGVCLGKTMTFSPFTGYDDPAHPAKFSITWDKTVRGSGLFSQVYVLKENASEYHVVPPCQSPPQRVWVWSHGHWHWEIRQILQTIFAWFVGGHTGFASPSPCVDAKTVLRNGDLRFDTLFLSGDPSMRRR